MDARSLLGALQNKMNNLSLVYVPSVEAEDGRDIVRQYFSISKELRRAKQQLRCLFIATWFCV